MCISWDMFCVLARASHMAYNFACNMLWNLENRYAIFMFVDWDSCTYYHLGVKRSHQWICPS